MTNSLNQIISLVTYGNELLNGQIQPFDFARKTAFSGFKQINFVLSNKKLFIFKPSEELIANNPSDWIEYLNSKQCKKLKLHNGNFSDAFFKKGHSLVNLDDWRKSWFIEAEFDKHSEFWSYRWLINSKNNSNFDVTYGLIKNRKKYTGIEYNVKESKDELKQSIENIMSFAGSLNQVKWKSQFEFASDILSSNNPESNFYIKDLLPKNYLSLTARQLLFSSFESWVFSPHHSSWINLKFSNPIQRKTHLKLSIDLYETIKKSIECAINSE